MSSYIYWLLGYTNDEIEADKKTLRYRNELMKQIRNSKLKLKSIDNFPEIPKIKNKRTFKNWGRTHSMHKVPFKFKNYR